MWQCGVITVLLWTSTTSPALCQSGDADWGSGFGISVATWATNSTHQAVGDEPVRATDTKPGLTPAFRSPTPSPHLQLRYKAEPDQCSVHFSTYAVSARELKAQNQELAYLKAIQHSNQAVVENLVQYVGAEVGDHGYTDVIQENMAGIRVDHLSSQGTVQKITEDLEKHLEGDDSSTAAKEKIRQESLAFEGMLRAAMLIARRLEISSQALHTSLTKQLRDIGSIHR